MLKTLFLVALALACPALAGQDHSPGTGKMIVSDPSVLAAALKAATGGETIELATGDYGALTLVDRAFGQPVTIASADPKRPARLSGVKLRSVSGIVLSGLDIGRDRGSEPEWGLMVDIRGGSDLSIVGGAIHGSRDGDPGNDMYGVQAVGTARMTIRGVRFEEVVRGAVIERSSDISITDSDFDLIRSDAINIPGTVRVTIARNHMSRFRPIPAIYDAAWKLVKDGDHPDGVQGFTSNQANGSQDILIEDNLLEFDPMHRSQGFWFRDEAALWKTGAGHKRITIRRNRIVSPNWQAISVVEVEDAVVTDNEVVNLPGGPPVPGAPVIPWISASAKTELRGNVAPHFMIDGKMAEAVGNRAVGRAIEDGKAAAVKTAWAKAFRAPPPDPRIAERDALRLSIPAETATRDTLTKKLAKDRARLKALDKALGG